MKLWDIRNFSKPVKIIGGLGNLRQSKMDISPDQNIIIAGAYDARYEKSMLNFYDVNFDQKAQIYLDETPVTDIKWASKINQILVAHGSSV